MDRRWNKHLKMYLIRWVDLSLYLLLRTGDLTLSPNLFAMFLFNFHVPQQVALLTFGLILDTSLMVIWTMPANVNGLLYYTTLEVSWSKILNTTSTSRDVGSATFSQRS